MNCFKQNGSAMLYVLLISALLAIPLAAFQAHTARELKTLQAIKASVNQNSDTENQIQTLVNGSDQNLLTNSLTTVLETTPWSRALLKNDSQTMPLQIISLNQSGPFPKPAWNYLVANLSLENSNCSLTTATRFSAALTCNFSGTVSSPGIFVGGNLKSSGDLKIENLKDALIQIAAPGAIDLSHKLILKDVVNSRLEIIAVGEIKISDLTLNNSSGVELVIHSALGKISLGTASAVSLCGATDSGKPLSLRAHSLNSVKLNGTELLSSGPTVVGCQIQLDQQTWPGRTVIGKL